MSYFDSWLLKPHLEIFTRSDGRQRLCVAVVEQNGLTRHAEVDLTGLENLVVGDALAELLAHRIAAAAKLVRGPEAPGVSP